MELTTDAVDAAPVFATGALDTVLVRAHVPRASPWPRSVAEHRRVLRAWHLVLSVDLACLLLPALWLVQYRHAVAVMAVLCVLLYAEGERYRPRLHLSLLDELPTLLGRALVAAALVASVTAVRHNPNAAADGFLRGSMTAISLVLCGRLATGYVIRVVRRRGGRHCTLLVGAGPVAADLARLLREHPSYGLRVLGCVDDGGPDRPAAAVTGWLGRLDQLADLVAWSGAEVLLVADVDSPEHRLIELIRRPAVAACDLLVVPRLCDVGRHPGPTDHIGAIPVVRVRPATLDGPRWVVKRLFDVALAALGLVAFSPVMLACAVAVRLEGGPGVLFRQQRVGRYGLRFSLIKFRSMRPAGPGEAETRWSIADDHRVGPVGRLLRRTSLDELPQLWNVLRGDMTLVGPRPERPYFVDRFTTEHPTYAGRHRVPTGLTGLAQVSGLRGDTSISDRTRYDNYYIENWSLWLDVKVLLRTVQEVLSARGR